jgi:RNA polymerase sigma-70 factor (ECF subfamily)
MGSDNSVTNEHALLERAKEYDQEALGELYDRYAPRIYAYIYRRVGNAHLAEDLTGDVFVRLMQAIQSERFWRTSFRAWLYRIAHNLVVDHYRRQPPAPYVSRATAGAGAPVWRRADRARNRAGPGENDGVCRGPSA